MTQLKTWLEQLAYTDFPDELIWAGTTIGSRPYASEIEDILAGDRGIAASAIFCVDQVPTICFVDASELGSSRPERIEQIRQRIWNQSLISAVLIIDSEAVEAYSVSKRTAQPDVFPTLKQVATSAGQRMKWSPGSLRIACRLGSIQRNALIIDS